MPARPGYFHHTILPDRKKTDHILEYRSRNNKIPFSCRYFFKRYLSCRQTMGIRSGHSKYVFINITENTGKNRIFRVRRGSKGNEIHHFCKIFAFHIYMERMINFRNQRKFCRISCGKMGIILARLKENSTFAFFLFHNNRTGRHHFYGRQKMGCRNKDGSPLFHISLAKSTDANGIIIRLKFNFSVFNGNKETIICV